MPVNVTPEDVKIDVPQMPSLVVARRGRRLKSSLQFDLHAQGIDSSLQCGVTSTEKQGFSKLEKNIVANGLAQQFAFDLVHNAMTYQSAFRSDGKRTPLKKENFGTAQTMCPDEEDVRFGTQRTSVTDARMSFEGRFTSQTTSSAGFSVPGLPWGNDRNSRSSVNSESSMSSMSSMSSENKQVMMKEALRSLRAMKRKFARSDKSKYHSGPPSLDTSRRPSEECGQDSSSTAADSRIIFHTPSLASLRKEKGGPGIKLPACKRGGDGTSPLNKSSAGCRVRRRLSLNCAGPSTPPYFASGPANFGFPASSEGSAEATPRRTFESESGSWSSYTDSQNGSFIAERIFSSSNSGVFSGTSSGSATPQRSWASASSCPAMFPEGEDHEPPERTSERGSMLPSRCFQTMPPIRENCDDGDNDSDVSGVRNDDLCLGEFS